MKNRIGMADKKKILIAESTQVVEIYRYILPNYDVEIVRDGEALFTRLRRGVEGIDMLVLEGGMQSEKRGYEIATEYKRKKTTLPVVVTSDTPEQYKSLAQANIPVYRITDTKTLADYMRKTLG